MAEKCPWKAGCKVYPNGRHYYGDYSYHVDENDPQGRHHIAVSSLKGVLDRDDPDLVGWRLKMARDLFQVKEKDQTPPTWPQPGDPMIGKGDEGWCFWEYKTRTWVPKQTLDYRFREAHFVCEQIAKSSAAVGHYIHWYIGALLWPVTDYNELFDPGEPPHLPQPFDAPLETDNGIEQLVVDYSATLTARKKMVEEFVGAFNPRPLALEMKLYCTLRTYTEEEVAVAGSFDAMTVFPKGMLSNICSHVVGWKDGNYGKELEINRGLSKPFQREEVVLVDWKTSKDHRFSTAVQLGLYYLLVRKAAQMTGTQPMIPERLLTVRFFEPQSIELRNPRARPGWDVLEVPVKIGMQLAADALFEAQKLGVVY